MTNPFEICDYIIEQDRDLDIPYINTTNSNLLEKAIINRVSLLLVGEKGIGKSSSIRVARDNLKKNKKLKRVIIAKAGTKILADVYNIIWDVIVGYPDSPGISYETATNEILKLDPWRWIEKKPRTDAKYCAYWNCKRRDRCVFQFTADTSMKSNNPVIQKNLMENLWLIRTDCPLKRLLTHHILDNDYLMREKINKLGGFSAIIDLPDNFSKYNLYILNELVSLFQRHGNVILVMTKNQYLVCKKSEVLTRLSAVKFPILTDTEIKKIVKAKYTDYKIPVNVLDKIIKENKHILRDIFHQCNNYLLNIESL